VTRIVAAHAGFRPGGLQSRVFRQMLQNTDRLYNYHKHPANRAQNVRQTDLLHARRRTLSSPWRNGQSNRDTASMRVVARVRKLTDGGQQVSLIGTAFEVEHTPCRWLFSRVPGKLYDRKIRLDPCNCS